MVTTTIAERIGQLIDRLANESTEDQDALNTVYALRRVVRNDLPSMLLAVKTIHVTPKRAEFNMLRDQLDDAHQDIADQIVDNERLQCANEQLAASNARLIDQCQRLQMKLDSIRETPVRGPDDPYCFADVMDIIHAKFGKQNGANTLWADYSKAQHEQDPKSPLLTTSHIQIWRQKGAYPAWAVQQLMEMPATSREVHKWTAENIEYLKQLHLCNPAMTDEQLAERCSECFKIKINTNSVKSKFNILRKRGEIPLVRPKNTRVPQAADG